MHPRIRQLIVIPLSLAVLVLSALLSGYQDTARAAHSRDGVTLTLVAYSTPQEAYNLIIPAFQKTKAGKGVSFQTSYGASGDQSRSVASGLPADLVAFSLEPDINRLVKAGLVSGSWYKNKYHGFVTDSVVVFVVRKGNPKHIRSWSDLIKPGIQVITPNPFTSGGARWNIMAAYGAQLAEGKKKSQAVAYLQKLFDHVPVQDKSARESLQTFVGGKGDVMLAYENEAITAQEKGQSVDYVIPRESILIENPVAVTKTSKHQTEAKAFAEFLWSTTAQKLFGEKGYRPVRADVLRSFHFRNPAKLFTIRTLGSWPAVQSVFFDPNQGIVTRIERNHGVSTQP